DSAAGAEESSLFAQSELHPGDGCKHPADILAVSDAVPHFPSRDHGGTVLLADVLLVLYLCAAARVGNDYWDVSRDGSFAQKLPEHHEYAEGSEAGGS